MKERLEVRLESETIQRLRSEAIRKYGNLRSVSKLIEDIYTSKNLPVKEEFEGTYIKSHNGVDIGGLNPNLIHSHLMCVWMDLGEIAKKRERKGGPAKDILRDIEFIHDLMDAIMKGMCDGSLDRWGMCPSCSGYSKNPDGTYSYGNVEYKEGAFCEVHKKN